MAAARGPSTRAPRDVGRPTGVPKFILPGRGPRPLPVRQAVRREGATPSATPTSRPMGAPVVLSTAEVQPTAVPRPEAASGVPLRRPIPIGKPAGPAKTQPTRVRALVARQVRAVPSVPTTVVPVVVLATAATAPTSVAASVASLSVRLALELEAHAVPLRRPREPVRTAATPAIVPATAMAPTRVPRVRGVAPAPSVTIPASTPSVAAAAAAARLSPATASQATRVQAARPTPLASLLARATIAPRRVRLATFATGTPTAIAPLPVPGLLPASGLAALAAHALGRAAATIPRPVPLSEPRSLAA